MWAMSHNWLSYGVIHNGIASYAHFHDADKNILTYGKHHLFKLCTALMKSKTSAGAFKLYSSP